MKKRDVMKKDGIINTEELRLKIVNMLKIYGYYDGILVNSSNEKGFVDGSLSLDDIILNRKDFKELKRSVKKLLDYCYENNFDELIREVNYFYQVMGKNIRKKFGNLFDKF